MNLEKTKLNIQEKIQPIKTLEEFKKIKNPEELLSFMKDNINYGFVGKNSKKIFTSNKDMDAGWDEYYLQSPRELLESKHGVCWDSTELERCWFLEHGYKPRVFFMMFEKEEGSDLPTHTFLTFNHNNKWYWFEHSFGNYRGIHEYGSFEDLINDVKKKKYEEAVKKHKAKVEDWECLKYYEYENPRYGSNPKEFVSNIIDNKI
ncbi:hypothetical protein A2331_03325 [Candidatus Falkowbacteria bacterium RIFOXYB2_FULL_34_18]|uniref:Transglutaminase-like domain-containing protein n=1 Tax=Candidatus Falkowbacteria bacterium RIFOXYD2_FULL_34_120 TaxID=1798007 RepID=A0A1F5TNQ9_9BACT|nr:MAG: hypothetical protein A2331_03325 [Candidatus Falkowbacteria bacterium RIFOXYB2_FULL_34_18]OGF28948.1 MAG: hypothetical protein A2500_01735 [Candidatus Falkowbacteria bacterium RIFOXYC12_FULL_34_55]OGF35853.1 MAG: hypothetical protein A2466_03645 [Candidatus Falkowbacteria bacterium RIFOXYC2_FULL_34_220]OGF38460.1 MAG: hypothetical protein A2515_07015 [Candidatus Falkowbacteria bacterium RIFOXYD12_FULL_34_57]OGF40526.1 MAG: hypothetical protein A2531_04430 [Candidatus Falkowbacteria bact